MPCSRSTCCRCPRPCAGLAERMANRRAKGRPGERLARALQELGPAFIKLGQSLSVRGDLLGRGDRPRPVRAAGPAALLPLGPGQGGGGGRAGAAAGRAVRLVRGPAGGRGLDRAGAFRGHRPRARRWRSRSCGRASRPQSSAISTSCSGSREWAERLRPALRRYRPVDSVRMLAADHAPRDGPAPGGRGRGGVPPELSRGRRLQGAAGRLAAHRPARGHLRAGGRAAGGRARAR